MDGELATRRAAELEEHIKSCEACRAELDELQKNEKLIASAFRNHPFNREMARRILGRIPGRRPVLARFGHMAIFAAAACILVAFGLIFVIDGPEPASESLPVAGAEYQTTDKILKQTFADGTTAVFGKDTKYRIEEKEDTAVVHLMQGRLYVESGSHEFDFCVMTPEAVCRPVGTRFNVERTIVKKKGRTILSVIEGVVEIETGDASEQVWPGKQMSADGARLTRSTKPKAAQKAAEWFLGSGNVKTSGAHTPVISSPKTTGQGNSSKTTIPPDLDNPIEIKDK
jgi:ferric-dicitrate binding protein FerR (iron transport regulator)